MKQHRNLVRATVAIAAAALVLTGCRGGGSSDEAVPGITDEPCPEAIDEEKGCIYLGVISDLTRGPFAPLAVPITDAQRAFWERVNENGGIGDYEVDLSRYVTDSEYNPELHNRRYQEMRNDVFALAQTLGSSQTMAILDDMIADDVIGGTASWNSAWDWEDQILQSGANYCFEAMNGVDWSVENRGVSEKVLAVHYPNDYGADAAAGVRVAAEANGLEFVAVETPTGQDNQAGAVAAVLREQPDLVYISTGPAEMATIVGQTAAQGFQGTFIGSSPTWNAALLQSAAAPALQAMFFHAGPWGPWNSDTPAHEAMREALGDVTPSEGYTAGWAWSYPLLRALEAAEAAGDLTREGLVQAAAELEEVDFEGMLPPESGNKAGDPSEVAWRESNISSIDPDSPTGLVLTSEMAAGPTATGYDYTEPCFALN